MFRFLYFVFQDQKCVLCEYAVTTLDKMITDKHNEDEVKQALDRLCGYLPGSINKQAITAHLPLN